MMCERAWPERNENMFWQYEGEQSVLNWVFLWWRRYGTMYLNWFEDEHYARSYLLQWPVQTCTKKSGPKILKTCSNLPKYNIQTTYVKSHQIVLKRPVQIHQKVAKWEF